MFGSILKDHRASSAVRRKQLDTLRQQALQSSELVTQHLFLESEAGVGALYANARVLQAEAATLQAHTARLAKQSDKWITMAEQMNTALKELGDVQNWALTLQKDVRWIETELQATLDHNNKQRMEEKERHDAEVKRRQDAAAQIAAEAAAAKQLSIRTNVAAAQQQQQQAMSPDQIEHVAGEDEELP